MTGIKECHLCHGKGFRNLITKLTFGPDAEIEEKTIPCRECDGEGKIYICPASKAPQIVNG